MMKIIFLIASVIGGLQWASSQIDPSAKVCAVLNSNTTFSTFANMSSYYQFASTHSNTQLLGEGICYCEADPSGVGGTLVTFSPADCTKTCPTTGPKVCVRRAPNNYKTENNICTAQKSACNSGPNGTETFIVAYEQCKSCYSVCPICEQITTPTTQTTPTTPTTKTTKKRRG